MRSRIVSFNNVQNMTFLSLSLSLSLFFPLIDFNVFAFNQHLTFVYHTWDFRIDFTFNFNCSSANDFPSRVNKVITFLSISFVQLYIDNFYPIFFSLSKLMLFNEQNKLLSIHLNLYNMKENATCRKSRRKT